MTDSMFSPDPRLLDRMVDGELSPKDERALLVQLDDEPAGWRQLALAFVESRTWQREFALAARDRGTVVSRAGSSLERSSRAVRRFAADGPDQPAGGRDSARRTRLLNRLSIAAVVALAFVTGLAAGRTSSSDARRPGRPSDFVNEPRPRAGQLVSTGNEATFAPGETAAGNQNAGRASSSRYEQTTLRVALQEPESGQTVPVEVPLVDVSEVGLAWPGPASALPLELRRRLEQTGHSIHETRHWVPVQLHDGRQVLLPVDHVQVELAETYQ